MGDRPTLWSIGHGSRPVEQFVALLEAAGIRQLADVRAVPASRRHPQYGRDALEGALRAAGIRYVWMGRALGGRRSPRGDTRHSALDDPALRAYADHMATPEFRSELERLIAEADAGRTAMLCAETRPEHCHRRLIADALVARGVPVLHIVDGAAALQHRLSDAARVCDGEVVYDRGVQRDMGL